MIFRIRLNLNNLMRTIMSMEQKKVTFLARLREQLNKFKA